MSRTTATINRITYSGTECSHCQMTDRDRCRVHIDRALRRATDQQPRDLEGELDAVTIAGNEWALAHGYRIVTIDTVQRIDQLCVGHVDWFDKLTFRVADEIVYGR